jgi:hypothetical protein
MRPSLLDALLDSWDRNNTVMVNLLGLLPEGGLDVRAHIRMVHVFEDAP